MERAIGVGFLVYLGSTLLLCIGDRVGAGVRADVESSLGFDVGAAAGIGMGTGAGVDMGSAHTNALHQRQEILRQMSVSF